MDLKVNLSVPNIAALNLIQISMALGVEIGELFPKVQALKKAK